MLYKEDFYNEDHIRKKRNHDVDRHGKKKDNQDGNEAKKKSRRWMLKDCLKTRQGSQDLKKSKDCYIQGQAN